MRVLVTAASQHGATRGIADAIVAGLGTRGVDASFVPPQEVEDLSPYQAVILGSAVYAGHWLKPATEFARRLSAQLGARDVWLFSSGPVGDPDRKLVQRMAEDPVDLEAVRRLTHARGHAMFSGALDRSSLTIPQRAALTVFRGMQGDFRDWAAVDRWVAGIAESLRPAQTGRHGPA